MPSRAADRREMMTEPVLSKRTSTTLKGLNRDVISAISEAKGEPDWMREFRLRSLEVFEEKPLPSISVTPLIAVVTQMWCSQYRE